MKVDVQGEQESRQRGVQPQRLTPTGPRIAQQAQVYWHDIRKKLESHHISS